MGEEVARHELELANARASRAELRLRQLHTLAAELSTSTSIEAAARVVLAAGVGAIGADIAGVWRVEGRFAVMVAQSESDPVVERVPRISLDVPMPLTLAVESGEPVFVETRFEYAARFPIAEAVSRTLSIGANAYACVPFILDGAVLAVMALAFRAERAFASDEREFLILLARHASIAFQRSIAHRAQLENSHRLRKLNDTTDALAEARTPAQVAEATVRLGAEAINALSGALWLEQPDATLLMLASFNVPANERSQWERVPVSADLPLCRVMRSNQTVWVSTSDEYARHAPEAFESTKQLDRGWGYVAFPLSSGGKPVGVLSFGFGGEHPFGEDERQFLETLATTCEHALDRARLFVEVAQASRNKDEFLAMLGHELRNPLAAMMTALDLIKMREQPLGREHAIMNRQLEHLVRMIGDLIDVSRITQGRISLEREAVDIVGAVEYAIETSRALIDQRGHEVVVEVARDLLVDADRERLGQVLANLVNNAAKYTQKKGRIEIRAHRDDDAVVIAVSDNGAGITSTLMPHLFDMFVQGERAADRKEGGLGVGLTAVRTLVALHGGSVSASSNGPGTGSTFTVRWPRPTSTTPTAKLPAIELDAASRLRVLIVDANEDDANALAALVASLGHEATIERDSETALRNAETSGPHIAIVDVSSKIDGYDLAKRFRMLPSMKNTSLVAITLRGYERDEPPERFSRHIEKPIDGAVLASILAPLVAKPSE